MRILILGINFSPENTGIAPYTTGLARNLATAHDVTVVTGMPHYPDWTVPKPYRAWRLVYEEDGVHVIRVSHHVPKRMNAVSRGVYEATWAARALMAGAGVEADAILAVVPALLGAHVARILARRKGVGFGLIVQDVMGSAATQAGVPGGRFIGGLTTKLERSALRRARGVSTIHPRLAKELAPYCIRPPAVIYNWAHIANASRRVNSLRGHFGWPSDEIIALHSGNMGAKQNLEVVVDAARLAEREGFAIRFILAGAGSQRPKVERYARRCEKVTFLDSIPNDDYLDFLSSADVLLVNERPGMDDMSLPSKVTSYLIAGRPILAAAGENSATAEFVRRSGGGIVVPPGDPASLLASILRITNDPELSDQLGRDGQMFAKAHLSAEAAFQEYGKWLMSLAPRNTAQSQDSWRIDN